MKKLSMKEGKILDHAVQDLFNRGQLGSDEQTADLAKHLFPQNNITSKHIFRSRVQRLRIIRRRTPSGEFGRWEQLSPKRKSRGSGKRRKTLAPVNRIARENTTSNGSFVTLTGVSNLLEQAQKALVRFADQEKARYNV